MVIKNYISDPLTGRKAVVVDGTGEQNALVVATRPLKTFTNSVKAFLNSTYGVGMNIDGSTGGTPLKVHNGIDDVLWTGTNIVDTVDFNSTTQYHTGTHSINFSDWSNTNDVCQIAKGSSQDLSGYSSLSLWIFVDDRWDANDSISVYGWDTGTGVMIGNKVYLQDYFDYTTQDTWQKINIGFSDMGLTGKTIDSIRFQYDVRDGIAANFFIDDIQFEESGTPISFRVNYENGKWIHCYNMRLLIADAFDSTLANSSVPNIDYSTILGEASLISGVSFRRVEDGEVVSSYTIHNIGDALFFPTAELSEVIGNATNTMLAIDFDFTSPIILKHETSDYLELVINDDLTGLTVLKASLGCKVEER